METNINAAKYAFFYLLSLVALVFMAMATGMVIFQIINKLIPDVPGFFQGSFSDSQLKYALSQLIISAPIFFLTMRQIHRYLFSGELTRNSAIRKWLTYLMLFVSSLVLIGWLIGTLNSFMQGELTAKFALKAITALGISGTVFSYFLYDIKRTEIKDKHDKVISIYFYSALVMVIVTFAGALFVVESPTETRDRKLDAMVIDNFNQIDMAIRTFYTENKKLPESLDTLQAEFSYLRDKDLKNPVTSELYEYKISGDKEYELCATFRISNLESESHDYYQDKRWLHEAGEVCLKQTVHANDDEIRMIKEIIR